MRIYIYFVRIDSKLL